MTLLINFSILILSPASVYFVTLIMVIVCKRVCVLFTGNLFVVSRKDNIDIAEIILFTDAANKELCDPFKRKFRHIVRTMYAGGLVNFDYVYIDKLREDDLKEFEVCTLYIDNENILNCHVEVEDILLTYVIL